MRDSHYMEYDPSPGPIGDGGAPIAAILIIAIIILLIIFLFYSPTPKKKKDDAVAEVKKIHDKLIDDAKTFGRVETVPPLEAAQRQVAEYIAKNWPDP